MTQALRAAHPQRQVELAHLDSLQTSPRQALEHAGQQGRQWVRIARPFLGAGGRLLSGVPPVVQDVGALHPGLRIDVAPPPRLTPG